MARSAIISLSSASHIQHVLGSSSNFNIQAFEPKPSVISRLISSLLCTAMSESNRDDYASFIPLDAVTPMSMHVKSDIPFPNNVTVTYATWFNRNWQSSGCE